MMATAGFPLPAPRAGHVIPTADDSAAFQECEEEVARQPYAVQTWLGFLRALRESSLPPEALAAARVAVFERALQALPRSYKLWKLFLDETYAREVRGRRPDSPAFGALAALYERALGTLGTMPRLWVDYLALLREMRAVTASRRVLDRALRALPITQHHRVWGPFLAFAEAAGAPQTAIRAHRRLLMLEPSRREAFVEYLVSVGQLEEASRQLVALLERREGDAGEAPGARGGATHRLWMQLSDLVSQHPERVAATLDVEAILRSGLARFSDEVGRLWCALATYFVRLGRFEAARDVYEEAVRSVATVRDFSMVYDAYVRFVEAMLTAEMDLASGQDAAAGDQAEQDEDEDEDEDDGVDHQEQVDRLLKVYEDVADRRPLLLNSVLLRQNPHNVREWEKRVELEQADPQQVARTFAEAVQTVDPQRAGGRLPSLWAKFAAFYEAHGELADARAVLRRAAAVEYRTAAELAEVYCAWAELELRHERFDEALELVRGACAAPTAAAAAARRRTRQAPSARDKLHQNARLWSLRVDLEEALGDVASTRAAYDDAFELRVATPQMVLQYAAFLEERRYFEESFRVFERGLALFPRFPHAGEIWQTYLRRFVARYGGSKMERARDLHEQAIQAAPAAAAKPFFDAYAALEEAHGLLRNVLAVYERAADAVPEEQRLEVFRAYVAKAQRFFGVAKAREVYARGVARLPDALVAPLSLQFAAMEAKLGEVERARAIYAHAAQFCDPRRAEADGDGGLWPVWHAFEVAHGSEHSFLEMLRVKRSVAAQYAQVNYVAAEGEPQAPDGPSDGPSGGPTGVAGMVAASDSATAAAADPISALEAALDGEAPAAKKRKLERDVEAKKEEEKEVAHVANEEEIDLDDEDEVEDEKPDEESGAGGDVDDVEERAAPSTLLGGS